jgi:transcription elongation factor GreA
MEKKEYLLTPDGENQLREELQYLINTKRKEIAQRLRHAVEMGDLSENADYISAKEDQAFLEGRIQELEIILRDAVIIQKSDSHDVVEVGSTVVVSQVDNAPETYQIVGVKEANPRQGKISHESPIGRALLGKQIGSVATVQTPGGKIELRILEIR